MFAVHNRKIFGGIKLLERQSRVKVHHEAIGYVGNLTVLTVRENAASASLSLGEL